MRLRSLELVNICQHERYLGDFRLGITGIFGPNGAGKSNLMKMAKASLTGDFSVNPGTKGDNVRWGVGANASSYVQAVWEHDGTEFSVLRGLQNCGSALSVKGGCELAKTREINEAIEQILGIPKAVIDGFIFVDQWKIFEFMSAKSADRANTFAHLCNTAHAERVWQAIGSRLHADVPPQLIDNSEELNRRIISLGQKRAEYQQRLVELKTAVLPETEVARLEQVIKTSESATIAAYNVTLKRAAVAELVSELDSKQKQSVKAHLVLETLTGKLAGLRDKYDVELRRAEFNTAAEKRNNRRRELLRQLVDVVVPALPAKPMDYRPPGELDLQIKQHEAILSQAGKVVRVFEQEAITNCPTCGTPVSTLTDYVDTQRQLCQTTTAELAVLRQQLTASKQWDDDCRRVSHERSKIESASSNARAALEEIGATIELIADADQTVLTNFQKLSADVQAATLKAASDERELSVLRTRLAAEEVRLKAAEQECERYKTTQDVDSAKQLLQQHREAKPELRTCQERIAELSAQILDDDRSLVALEQATARIEKLRAWSEELESWRPIVHRDALPRMVANNLLENLVERMNTTLDEFASSFSVSASDDLTFVVRRPGGLTSTADRLSGGEKVVLALAFRFAVNSLFAGEVGMLVLDEPTAGLDTANLECLTDVLGQLSELTRKRGQQLIIITHDRRLERVFDTIIDIKAP